MKNVSLRQLRVFASVAKHLSFARAAEELNLSPPAVSMQIKELEAATLPRVLDQVHLALINTNYALEAKLDPEKDALVIEGSDSPYVNFLVARPDNKNSEAIQKLAKALTSPEVKAFIEQKYKGAVVPAF